LFFYGFELIDPQNRLLVHVFRSQVFYHADEQTPLVARAGCTSRPTVSRQDGIRGCWFSFPSFPNSRLGTHEFETPFRGCGSDRRGSLGLAPFGKRSFQGCVPKRSLGTRRKGTSHARSYRVSSSPTGTLTMD